MGEIKNEWKAYLGYEINKKTGLVQENSNFAVSLFFNHAFPEDILELIDKDYRCKVVFYSKERPLNYIYTYDYQAEQNWATYIKKSIDISLKNRKFVFDEECYFRIEIEYKANCVNNKGDKIDLSSILRWNRIGKKDDDRISNVFKYEIFDTIHDITKINQEAESINFFLLTDSHYTVNGTWNSTISNMKKIEKAIPIKGLLHLGDLTDGMLKKEMTSSYVSLMRKDLGSLQVPIFFTLGNHDYNYFGGNREVLDHSQIRKIYFDSQGENYYYHDFNENKLRMIFLESFDPNEKIRYGFDTKQLEWLDEVLESTPRDMHTIIFSHVPPVPRLHYWSDKIRCSDRLMRILERYQITSQGKLLAYIHGHNHCDQIDVQESFPIISIGCAKCEFFRDKKPEGATTYERKLDEVSQELWDVLVVSTIQETIDLVRFGAGENRHIDCKAHYKSYMKKNIYGEKNMKKVITYGTFDLFHKGHYNILKHAKELGDYLIVGITSERYDEQRGKFNIIDSLTERIENVRSTGLADEIIIEEYEGQKIDDIKKYGIDVFTLGSDWKGHFDYLREYCEVVYLDRTVGISSTMLREAKYPIIRIGIVGTGRIAPRFLAEARYVSGLEIQSAYNPNRESADRFAEEHSLNVYCGPFEEFLSEVDAIYIATPHEFHYQYAKEALLNGKHVLCEKPLALTKAQVVELFSLARERNLILMEGIKTAYCPGFNQIIEIAKSGKIGEVRDVEACFSRLTPPTLREMIDEEYGGAFMEFGSYTLLPIMKLFGTNYEAFEIHSIKDENGVDLYTKLYFRYKNGLATSKTGIGVKSEGQLLISGTNGYILAESPWWLTKKFQVRYENPNQIEEYKTVFIGDGLRYEISDFVCRIRGFEGPKCKLLEEESIAMAGVVEKFLEKRKQDKKELIENNKNSGVGIWAHRGCSYQYTENTMEAFAAACELDGLKGIELDVQLTKDGEVVVFHDNSLERLLGRKGSVKDYNYEELKKLKFCDGLKGNIPRFEEVLQLVKSYNRGILINVELKASQSEYGELSEKLLELIKKYQMEPYIIISSFNGEAVRYINETAPYLQTGLLASSIEECIQNVDGTDIEALHLYVDALISYEGEIDKDKVIRVWNDCEPFCGQAKRTKIYNLCELKARRVKDFITNYPEKYLS